MRKDGSRFWASVIITALRDEAARCGFAKITRDCPSGGTPRSSLRQAEERFRLLVEGVARLRPLHARRDGRITTWNSVPNG